MAGELLVPTYFTNLLRKIMLPKNSLDKLKDYVQYKQQVEDSMTIIGNVKDRERCKNICACLPTVMQDFDRFFNFSNF